MAKTLLNGIAASDGLVRGKLLIKKIFDENKQHIPGSTGVELALFKDSIRTAKVQLKKIMNKQDQTAAEIIEFQFELLNDESFIAPSIKRIEQGEGAYKAWEAALDHEIADYTTSDSEYLADRADDIKDLKERVLKLILPEIASDENDKNNALNQVMIAETLTPSEFLELDLTKIVGIALSEGSATSHVSILARSRDLPMLIGCGKEILNLRSGEEAILDASRAELLISPSDKEIISFVELRQSLEKIKSEANQRMGEPVSTANGEVVKIFINIDEPTIIEDISIDSFDGVGLTRTEFLFQGESLPDEQEQYEVYKKIILWANGKATTIRTLDAGGDKPISGVTIKEEANPFLGVRGYRLSQQNRELFLEQVRALVRAAVHGPLKIMLPMITIPQEMSEFRALVAEVVKDLKSKGIDCSIPSLGMMVEVPAAALTAEEFDADFYSIGSNDLIQYTTACARDNSALSHLAQGNNRGVIRLISMVVSAANQRNVELSVCGEMASMPSMIPYLLGAGVRNLSVSAGQLAMVKKAVREWDDKSWRGE